MTKDEKMFLFLLFVNFTAVAVYFIYGFFFRKNKEGRSQYVINSVIMLLCPLAGLMFFLAGTLFKYIFMYREVNLSDVVFDKERIKTVERADEEREINMASIEETLAIGDERTMRRLMLNVIRGNITDSLYVISEALNSEDTETAHYAASVLIDELNNFRLKVHKMYTWLLENRNYKAENRQEELLKKEKCFKTCSELVVYMNDVLMQKVLTDMEQKNFVLLMDEVCGILYEDNAEKMEAEYYEMIIMRLLEIGKFDIAEKWCERAAKRYPDELFTYTCMFKLYFMSGQRDKFFVKLNELKKSDVVVDRETLDLIHIFS